MNNPLITFLASYGPQPSSNNLYDEFVVEAAQMTGCAPLEIEQTVSVQLEEMLRSAKPISVILTGTAGDGKTYTARKLVEALSSGSLSWSNTEKVLEIPLPGNQGHKIHFIKDLSELNEKDKDELFDDVRHSLLGRAKDIFVICVNDGHLLKFFRDRAERGGQPLHDRVAQMLQEDQDKDPDENFLLVNMSRRTDHEVIDRIIDAVALHPDWDKCLGCTAFDNATAPCPIRLNLDLLRRTEANSMRARLKDMIRMAAADGQHLSIRQLILLTTNILLGDRMGNSALLTCTKARNRASTGNYADTNPYLNVFGENLSPKERRQYGTFTVMGGFGIGQETNNFFDHNLLWNEEGVLPQDPIYGNAVFDAHRQDYTRDPALHAKKFRQEMVTQRRRIFFSADPQAPSVVDDPRQDPWQLSVYQHSARYMRLVDTLTVGDGRVPKDIAESLIRGLNRMMTGEMTTTDTRLWLTEPSGAYLGQEIPLLIAEAGREQEGLDAFITFPRIVGNGKPPVLRFTPRNGSDFPEELALRPTIFECLMRVSNGTLPSSFSSEFRQEVSRFQLRAAAAIRAANELHTPILQQIEMNKGELARKQIPIMTDEGSW